MPSQQRFSSDSIANTRLSRVSIGTFCNLHLVIRFAAMYLCKWRLMPLISVQFISNREAQELRDGV